VINSKTAKRYNELPRSDVLVSVNYIPCVFEVECEVCGKIEDLYDSNGHKLCLECLEV